MALHSDFLTKPLAHRGLHSQTAKAPENSVRAVELAVKNGYGIELDLQLSKDGQPVVFHDYVLDRLTDQSGPVAQHTARQLAEISLQGTDQTILTLDKLLGVIDGNAPLLIELKDQDGALGPNSLALEKALAKVLQSYGGLVAVMSFNPHMVANLARLAPNVCRGLVTSGFPKEDWGQVSEKRLQEVRGVPDFDRVGASFISHKAQHLDGPRVAELKSAGVPILCWTVRSQQQENTARKVADNITFEDYAPAVALR